MMAGILIAAQAGLVAAGVPALARLVVLVAVGGVAYVVCCVWRAPELTSEIRAVIARRERVPPQAQVAPVAEH